MGIIDRLLIRETLKTLVVITSVLVLLIVANTMVRLLGQTAAGLISPELMIDLLSLSLYKLLAFILPPALFFSVLWVLGNMYRDSEMSALFSAGVSEWRLLRPLLLLALPVAALVAWLSIWVVPDARVESERVRQEDSANIRLSGIRPRSFNEFNDGKLVVFANSAEADSGILHQVFIQHIQDGKAGVVVADRARLDMDVESGARFVVLENGHRYQGEEGVNEYSISKFHEYGVRMPDVQTAGASNALAAKPSAQLLGSPLIAERAELQYRLSTPASVVVFLLVALPLAKSNPRQGVYVRLMLAVLVFALYLNLQRAAQDWMTNQVVPEALGLWWLPLVMVIGALAFHYFDSIAFRTSWERWRSRGRA